MSIKLHRAFEVRRPAEEVWRFLTDPHSIAGCMPGAHLLDIVDGELVGEVDLRFGPFGTRLAGRAGFREMDTRERTVMMEATAREATGDGTADIRMHSRLCAADRSLTRVDVRLAVRLAGRLAGPIISRMLAAAGELLLRRFSSCVRHRLESAHGQTGD